VTVPAGIEQPLQYLHEVTHAYMRGVWACYLMSTRSQEWTENSMMFRLVLDTMQSPIAIQSLIETGLHNPARRELRYVLESAVKYLHVDEALPQAPLPEKLDFLHHGVPRSSISVIDDVDVSLPAPAMPRFRADVKDVFKQMSGFVHPSRRQIDAYLRQFDKGSWPGNESVSEAWKMSRLVFRVYDLVLVLLFTGVGPSLAGDIFVHVFDDEPEWKFHKGTHMKQHSQLHDAKHERQSRQSLSS